MTGIFVYALFAAVAVVACTEGCHYADSTEALPPVRDFELARYLGIWYEIARMPHSFERDMTHVRARYTLRPDGKTVDVENSGTQNGKKRRISGIARMAGAPDRGLLKVSFFRPFYGEYKILYLEKDYSAALVTSSTKDYFWILARTRIIPEKQLRKYIQFARICGFNTEKLEFPAQETPVAGEFPQ